VASKDNKSTVGVTKIHDEGPIDYDDSDSAYHSVGNRELLGDDSVSVDVGGLHGMRTDPWGKAYQLHIHNGGLIPIEDTTPYVAFNLPTRSSEGLSRQVATVSKVSGSSSIGGWGVDAGTVWKPISLPPSSSAVTNTASTRQQKNSVSSSKKSSPSDNCKGEVVRTDRDMPTMMMMMTELVIRKEEFFKSVLKKMSAYFAIIGPKGDMSQHTTLIWSGLVPYACSSNRCPLAQQFSSFTTSSDYLSLLHRGGYLGSLTVHSGPLPKVKVMVETRMGSKVGT